MSIPRKYVDSHWLIFAFQGIIALLFGWFAMFTGLKDTATLVTVVGATLLGLGIVELFNLLRRAHLKETWGLSLGVALLEIAVAMALLFTLNLNIAWHIGIIAGYTIIRGVVEILIGLRSIDDRTDKAIWIITGICGAVLGFVILNSGNLENNSAFVQFFGSYMMIWGLANLIYGVHNHDQKQELKEEQQKIAKKATATRKKNTAKAPVKATKTVKKTTKAPAKKSSAKKK